MTSHNATRNAHDVMWKWIDRQRQRRTCYRAQYYNVAWCSIYECLFELSSTTNILHCHLMHNKNTFPPTILEMYVSLPALTETCFEVNTLGEFAPDRSVCSVGGGIEGGGMNLLPLQRHTCGTSLSTWLPMPAVLCSKSAADTANLSIFTLRHVHCGLRCATSSLGHIEYMIADAWLGTTTVQCWLSPQWF